MKHRLIMLSIMLLGTFATWAQQINFENESWQKVIAKAQKENRIIFVDVFAAWSGESKQMKQIGFQHKDVSALYNEQFINYSIDGEIGDGKAIVSKYMVKGYPTQLFINAKDQTIIAKYTGYADAQTLISRARRSLVAQKDTKTWAAYQSEYHKSKKNEEFLKAYITKGSYIDASVDEAISDYIKAFKPEEPNTETIEFLTEYIKTLNNKGVDYIVDIYAPLPNGVQMLDMWLPTLYDNTFDVAVAKKDVSILKRILWASEQTKNPAASSIYQRFLGNYYLKTNDLTSYWKTSEAQIQSYIQKGIAQYRMEDSIAYDELVSSYKAQLKQYGVPEAEYMTYIEETLKGKVEAQYQSSYMAASNMHEILVVILEKGSNYKEVLQKATVWSDYMLSLIEPLTFEWSYFGTTAAEIFLKNNAPDKAKAIYDKGIEKADGNREIIKLLESEKIKYKL